ncbi:LysR family transcriptional regulator [Nocardioides sp. KIGAM211]|uniref:LysR family transcriptional regulator n=1 Tax=Nocardioides luti TaxID=2761101 RepID=A0A7X0VAA1_9ACTN|nr:LysR family transcriptional regulator [Nocardioides luti]MBB6627120.1 LysR family transcriptional regulator [Nocardioides luti]
MDVRRLELLLELSRHGSMRAVADELGLTTSTVSQQIAALAREVGTALLEPDGRRVRLTPAGHRLAGHAVTVLAAVEAARLDLDPTADPAGTVRIGGFSTAIRRSLVPVSAGLARTHPLVRLHLLEHEPLEAFDLLARDDVDLALVYDYNLAPAPVRADVETRELWTTAWGLGVPADAPAPPAGAAAADVVAAYANRPWIVNSRNTADEDAVRTLASLGGFTPEIAHRIDDLALVEELVAGGYGVGLLPQERPVADGVRVLGLDGPDVRLRAYAAFRRGRDAWPPLRLVLERIAADLSGAAGA